MLPVLMAILTILIVVTVLIGVVRSLVRMWLDYRVRMAVIRKVDQPGEPLHHPDDVQEAIDLISGEAKRPRANHVLTGVILAALGLVTMFVGRGMRTGPVAVGLDLGGWVCIALGVAFAVVGSIFWLLERQNTPSESN